MNHTKNTQRKNCTIWTDEMKLILCKEVYQKKGYLKTDQSMEVKWASIVERLKIKPEFLDMQLSWTNCKVQFDRFQAEVLKELGFSDDLANLSMV